MFNRTHDARVRSAAFEWLTDQVMRYGDVLPREAMDYLEFIARVTSHIPDKGQRPHSSIT